MTTETTEFSPAPGTLIVDESHHQDDDDGLLQDPQPRILRCHDRDASSSSPTTVLPDDHDSDNDKDGNEPPEEEEEEDRKLQLLCDENDDELLPPDEDSELCLVQQEQENNNIDEQQQEEDDCGIDDTNDTTNILQIVVLISTQSMNRDITKRQERMFTILESALLQTGRTSDVSITIVDGADPICKELRTNLFSVSGLGPTQYPQIFLIYKNEMEFWGNYEKLEYCNDNGTLVEELLLLLVPQQQLLSPPIIAGRVPSLSSTYDPLPPQPLVKNTTTTHYDDDEHNNTTNGGGSTTTKNTSTSEKVEEEDDDDESPCVRANPKKEEQQQQPAPNVMEQKNVSIIRSTNDGEDDAIVDAADAAIGGETIVSGGRHHSNTTMSLVVSTTTSTTSHDDEKNAKMVDATATASPLLNNKTPPPGKSKRQIVLLSLQQQQQSSVPMVVGAKTVLPSSTNNHTKVRGNGGTTTTDAPVAGGGSGNEPSGGTAGTKSSSSTGRPPLPPGASKQASGKGRGNDTTMVSGGQDATATSLSSDGSIKTEMTLYGATSFVAKHALDYFMQVSLTLPGTRTITLAGRNEEKIQALQATLTKKMSNLTLVDDNAAGKCVFDTFVADTADSSKLKAMSERTKVVVNFAGPYTKYSEPVVAACAQTGTDYIDITGEFSWAGLMRQKYSETAEQTDARIISLCGYDSVPSDLAVFAAAQALEQKLGRKPEIDSATTWHYAVGLANGGTIHSAIDIPIDIGHCLSRPVPFLMDDPLVLAHPRTRFDPDFRDMKNHMAKTEWWNQLPSIDSILCLGVSAPFFMAPVNSKVVNASAVALKYGPNFAYRERFLPTGFDWTIKLGLLAFIPCLLTQFGLLLLVAILKTPVIGKFLANWLTPPGSGSSDYVCQSGKAEVYADVSTPPNVSGLVNRSNCSMKFKGDPGNWVTAQCVCEAALCLVLDKAKLPFRSKDGFGTPAELLGPVLLERLQKTKVRPVEIYINTRQNVARNEGVLFR